MTCLALATLDSIPATVHIARTNAEIRARHPESVWILPVAEAYCWAPWGVITAADYEREMEKEYEKEMRKASYYDHWVEEEEPEVDPMEGWFI